MTDLVHVADRLSASSPLDEIRRRHAELVRGVLLSVPVPGYGGKLVARFAKLSPEDLKAATEAALATRDKSADAQLTMAAGLVVRHVRDVCGIGPTGDPVPLIDDDGEAVRFDHRLAELLDIALPPGSHDRVVLLAVLGRGNEAGVQGMASQFLAWSAGLSEEARETLQGESEATLP